MAWYHRIRERPQRTPDGKLASAPTKEQQATKLADAEEFKPAPLAMSENLPVPIDPKTGKSKPADQTAPTANALTPASTAQAKPTTAPQATSIQSTRAAPASPASKPAPKPAPTIITVNKTGLTREEIAELKAKEATLEAKVDRARQDFKALAANEENAEKAYKEYPAYAKRCIDWVDEMIDMAEERADAQAASHYRKIIVEIRRDEPPKPKNEKPTFEQYRANPSKYGKAPGVSSTYKPTASDLAAQPFQPYKASCTGWGYKAAENCKNCRAMDNMVHCPCGCGSYVPIDRNYDPFGRQESPEFKGGTPRSSGRPW